MNDLDQYYMRKALRLARRAKGKTSPNPLVGALVVKKNRILGYGWHKQAGHPHAEILALDKAGSRAKGAKLYVNLEPCSHFGRTPPCTERIIKSGIKEVIVGMKDPNPLNNGKGIRMLQKAGIKLKMGVLEKEAKRINNVFIKYITQDIPFITVKVAETLDGKIATRAGDSKWITKKTARDYAHKMRRNFDAIMVGVNTILRDDPFLDVDCQAEDRKVFTKIVVDSKLKTPPTSRIFSQDARVIIATLKKNKFHKIEPSTLRYYSVSMVSVVEPSISLRVKRQRLLTEKGAKILFVKEKNKRICLKDLMKRLAELEITNILVEGGGRLIGSLFEERLVDKVLFFIAPKIIGGSKAISPVEGEGIDKIKEAIRLKEIKVRRLGEDVLIEGDVFY